MKLSEKNKDFFDQVYQVVRLVPKGRVTSYGAIARYLGVGRSSRMVGWAMNASHEARPKVPAHRVVNSSGLLTGKHHFKTPFDMQERLEKEGVKVKNDKVQKFKELNWEPIKELEL
ncbi:MAG: MGMT family protein [Flavobacteriales bacterium]|nr:MGMT family protein [Flavobacteriales bacterium]